MKLQSLSLMMRELSILTVAFATLSCKNSQTAETPVQQPALLLSAEDQSRCDYDRPDRDVQESAAPGTVRPNIRRVYGYIGEGDQQRRVLLCREADTNFDGKKDLVRTYDDQGQKLTEEADADYDGRIDTWIFYDGRRPVRVTVDTTGDGRADETRFYSEGALLRIQRDTNADGNSDIFEVYKEGTLQRMGVDLNHDGRVDRWEVDTARIRELAEAAAGGGSPQSEATEETQDAEEAATEEPD
ncbi:MAG: hypothetical protein MK135_08280 [Polyangiaceae bacterium]|nr:hypothetical protein [Polyangiaceae bacterium]